MAVAQTKQADQVADERRPAGTAAQAGAVADFSKEEEFHALRQMLLIRRFEEKAGQMYGMGLIGGFCHLYIGQEAVVVGMQMAKRDGDQMITGYRDHGHMLACGMDPKGRDGGTHRAARRLLQGQGRLDAHVLPREEFLWRARHCRRAGADRHRACLRQQISQQRQRLPDLFRRRRGEPGQVYESFNMAELWKLPVVYVIENNRYAMGTAVTRSTAQTDLSKRGLSFNIPGVEVDGMDVRAVKAAGEEALAWCRAGKGPTIIEMMTYRYRGHSMSDPAKYRTKEEVDRVRTEHDPIEQVRARLLAKKWADEDELKKIDASVRAVVNEAAEFATNDPEPDPAELYTDVYR